MPAGSGRYPSGQRGQTVNLLAYAFGGSNPPLPTILAIGVSTAGTGGGLFETGGAPTRPVNRRAGDGADSTFRGNSSAVERQPSKLGVAGSNPVSRSIVTMGLGAARSVGGRFQMGAAPNVAMGLSAARGVGGLSQMGAAPTGAVDRRGVADIGVRSVGARGVVHAACAAGARPTDSTDCAHVAQLAEHALGKGEVSGSIPDMGSRYASPTKRGAQGG
jgi:hypothetical protein